MTTWTVPVTVVRLIDGDTIKVNLDLGWHVDYKDVSVRFAGINAPERSQPGAAEALAYLATLIKPGDALVCESHSLDKYGRVLGYLIRADGLNLSTAMLDSGHAVVDDRLEHP